MKARNPDEESARFYAEWEKGCTCGSKSPDTCECFCPECNEIGWCRCCEADRQFDLKREDRFFGRF